jgi:outer membrane protein assembly factor BamB
MANGRAIGRFEAALGVIGLLALGVTYSVATHRNPLPAVQGWLDRSQTLAEPAPAWTVRTGDQPSWAVAAGAVAVVEAGGTVSGYGLANGSQVWSRAATWAAVAGSGAGAVVVIGQPRQGYQVLDAASGTVRWSDPAAIGAWTFTDLVIGIACPQGVLCVLTARTPQAGTVRWQLALPGDGRPLGGANRPLVGIRPLGPVDHAPRPAPALLGFPVGDQVQVVDTAAGTRPGTYRATPSAWIVVAGTRVVVSRGDAKRGKCTLTAEGRDPAGDRLVWQRAGYDLRTGSACDQRTDPAGGAGLLAAHSRGACRSDSQPALDCPDGRDVLLDPATGEEVFRAGAGEKLLDTDGTLVLVRTADRTAVRAVAVNSGATRWTRPAARDAGVALGPGVVVFTDLAANRLTAVSASGAVVADVSSAATVLGFAADGVLVNIGRQVGLVRYAR